MLIEKKIVTVENAPEEYRLVVVSDIHAHKDLFNQLMNQVGLKDTDYLVILGDFLEKGPDSLEMLYKIRDLKQRERTFVLIGNCEAALVEMLEREEMAEGLVRYLTESPWQSLLKDTSEALKINYKKLSALEVQTKLR